MEEPSVLDNPDRATNRLLTAIALVGALAFCDLVWALYAMAEHW